MSNIEEDIKRCEKLIEPQNANWIGITNQLAIAHLIEKVKELRAMCEEYCPKAERIKELEEENKKYIVQLTDEQYRNLVEIIRKEVKQEFEQKVKDVLQNNRNELFSVTYLDDEQYKPYTMQIDRINKIEKELLEDK